MKKSHQLYHHFISVYSESQLIRIHSNKALWVYLNGKIDPNLNLLIKEIKLEYIKTYDKSLEISDESLFVEILVHVYCHYVGLKLIRFVKIKFLNQWIETLIKRAEIIDCGETKKDSNRWIWNYLSNYKKLLLWILPKEFKLHILYSTN